MWKNWRNRTQGLLPLDCWFQGFRLFPESKFRKLLCCHVIWNDTIPLTPLDSSNSSRKMASSPLPRLLEVHFLRVTQFASKPQVHRRVLGRGESDAKWVPLWSARGYWCRGIHSFLLSHLPNTKPPLAPSVRDGPGHWLNMQWIELQIKGGKEGQIFIGFTLGKERASIGSKP